jgi:hypothetical protein
METSNQAEKTSRHYLEQFSESWFKWMGWVIIVAVFHTAGERSEVWIVQGVAWLSSLMFFVLAWLTLEDYAVKLLPPPRKLPTGIVWLVTFIIASIPFVLIFFLTSIFKGFLS